MYEVQQLADDHERILERCASLLRELRSPTRDPHHLSLDLARLATLVRDHLGREEPAIYDTVDAAAGTRHADAAHRAAEAFEQLKSDWGDYLHRWDRGHVAAQCDVFAVETTLMLDRLAARVEFENAILYSLGVHHAVLR